MRPAAVLVLAALAVAGCGAGSPHGSDPSPVAKQKCLPAWPVVSPIRAASGGSVVLRSRGLRCDPFSKPQTYTVMLAAPQKPGGLPDWEGERKLTSFRVGVRGAFRVVLRLPGTLAPGSAGVEIHGPELDRRLTCQDTGACKAYGAGFIVKRPG